MRSIQKLVIRLVLAAIISIAVWSLFFPHTEYEKVVGLAILIFALSYLFEYLRGVGKGDNRGK